MGAPVRWPGSPLARRLRGDERGNGGRAVGGAAARTSGEPPSSPARRGAGCPAPNPAMHGLFYPRAPGRPYTRQIPAPEGARPERPTAWAGLRSLRPEDQRPFARRGPSRPILVRRPRITGPPCRQARVRPAEEDSKVTSSWGPWRSKPKIVRVRSAGHSRPKRGTHLHSTRRSDLPRAGRPALRTPLATRGAMPRGRIWRARSSRVGRSVAANGAPPTGNAMPLAARAWP
jgi:hypothetical protein